MTLRTMEEKEKERREREMKTYLLTSQRDTNSLFLTTRGSTVS